MPTDHQTRYAIRHGNVWMMSPHRRYGPNRHVQPLWTEDADRAFAYANRETAERHLAVAGDGAEVVQVGQAADQDRAEAAARCPVDQLLHDEYVHLHLQARQAGVAR